MDKLWEKIKESLSIYFDSNIPKWLKTKRALRKEVKCRFIEVMKEEIQKQIKEEEDLILYGDPNGIKPIGIIQQCQELTADQIYDFPKELAKSLDKENKTHGQEKTHYKDGKG